MMDWNLMETGALFLVFIGVACSKSVTTEQSTLAQTTSGPSSHQESGDAGENNQALSGDEAALTTELSSNSGKRDVSGLTCTPSPPGVDKDCIFCYGEYTSPVTDSQGITCDCLVCAPGQIVNQTCQCNIDGTVYKDTNCEVVKSGDGYMPESNLCKKPYPCSECTGDFVRVRGCVGVDDSICDCPKEHYQTGLDTCEPYPLCMENYERTMYPTPNSSYLTFICVPCPEGMYQPFNDSTDPCRLRPTLKPTQRPAVPTSTATEASNPKDLTPAKDPIHPPDCDIPTLSDFQVCTVYITALCILGPFIPLAYLLGCYQKVVRDLIIMPVLQYISRSNHGSYNVAQLEEDKCDEDNAMDPVEQSPSGNNNNAAFFNN